MEKSNIVLPPAPKNRLGRGLSALIPPSDTPRPAFGTDPPPVASAAGSHETVQELAIAAIVPNTLQPRTEFDPDALAELAASIAAHGVLQPVLVRPSGQGRYELVAGERRFRASQQAGLTRIPAIVRELTEEESLTVALIENIQREDLNAIEAARGYRQLLDQFGLTQSDLGRQLGKAQPTIANALSLLRLPAEMQDSISQGQMTPEHGKLLLSLPDTQTRRALWRAIIDRRLSVAEARRIAQAEASSMQTPLRRPAAEKSVHWQSLEDRLRAALGAKVAVRAGRGGRSTVTVEFATPEEVEGLLDRLTAA